MKLFLDENLPKSFVKELTSLGFEVKHVSDVGLIGSKDKEIAVYAKKERAILITKDLEFGNLIIYPKNSHYGLIVLRLPYNFNVAQILKSLNDFFLNFDQNDLPGKIIVLELGKYRIRTI